MQPILENTITDQQKDAIFYILSSQDQPVGTMFQIFSVIVKKLHDPIFTKIDFDWDIKKRTTRIEVPELLRARSEPIRNPVTDKEHLSCQTAGFSTRRKTQRATRKASAN